MRCPVLAAFSAVVEWVSIHNLVCGVISAVSAAILVHHINHQPLRSSSLSLNKTSVFEQDRRILGFAVRSIVDLRLLSSLLGML